MVTLTNANYQKIGSLYVAYKQILEDFANTPMTQRILFMGITFYLIYLLGSWIFSRVKNIRPVYAGDFQLYNELRTETSNFPNSGLTYTPSTDVIHSSLLKETNLGNTSYSFFVYICSTNYSKPSADISKPMVIFARGIPTGPNDSKQYPFIKCTPYVYLDSTMNTIYVVYTDNEHPAGIRMAIPSIEMDQWVHIGIVMELAKSVTLYHNGKVIQNANVDTLSIIDSNTLDVYFHPQTEYSRGFEGSIGLFLYHDGVYTPKQMEQIYTKQLITVREWERTNILEKEKILSPPVVRQ
jgi:hypothetical protein